MVPKTGTTRHKFMCSGHHHIFGSHKPQKLMDKRGNGRNGTSENVRCKLKKEKNLTYHGNRSFCYVNVWRNVIDTALTLHMKRGCLHILFLAFTLYQYQKKIVF
ncbi:hypothetical protein PHAVU_003G043800 [Phaseolus vulgaris]|uniref:Uncharacterized protein n=1 Tax=Phaseolus vulgaris TaxID=3885 RepID=V7C9D4_PHAVU|nr:hypothetical protein PHAVU_003G043800g [Phaseolus vulgaris]ESW25531.1 hypothetical protein PHAVU_003G043800g [Phaseolus vulgaris]